MQIFRSAPSSCNSDCKATKTRTCTNPEPINDSDKCIGDASLTRSIKIVKEFQSDVVKIIMEFQITFSALALAEIVQAEPAAR